MLKIKNKLNNFFSLINHYIINRIHFVILILIEIFEFNN